MKNDGNRPGPLARRRFLQTLAAGTTLALPGWILAKNTIWVPQDLALTPMQTEGPFYPETTIEQQLYNDTDLTRKLDSHELAKGQMTVVSGVIQDQGGRPLAGAVVEAWQACATGRYNHTRDSENPSLLDNNFQFWGRVITGEDGRYAFQSIIPGKYPGRNGRHIHFRVDIDGFRRLSTQCYFDEFGEDNARDGIYLSLTREERSLVTVQLDKPENAEGKKPKPWNGTFDMVLAKR